MSLTTNEDSYSLGKCSLKLLIQLIDTDSVNEVSNIIIILLAFENDGNVKSDEDVIIGRASANWEFVDDILLCHKELDLGPREAEYETSLLLNMVKFTVFRNNRVGSLRPSIQIK